MIVILGAGLAGLSTAYHLRRGGRRDVALHEREERPGGLCRSETRDGFTFDHTGHFLHLRTPKVERLLSRWLGRELDRVIR
ncbi:MAG: FAD-dependent oxidoreductase, partial [Planctomycetes bacterium]|nr:FAD-dependent oxidoreductase [Planctomycetota bacterium]